MATPKAQWVTAVHQDGKDPKYITACQTYKTVITQELENASLKWRYYVGASGSGTSSYAPDVTWISLQIKIRITPAMGLPLTVTAPTG